MNIQELILAALQTKFPGVDVAILTRIAAKKAEGVTDADMVDSIVEGISVADLLTSYGDSRADQAQKSAVANYEKKHGLKNGKPAVEESTEKQKPTEKQKEEDMPVWAQSLKDSFLSISTELASIKAEKAHATRQEQISAKAKEYNIPANIAKRCNIGDEEDLDAYFKELKQELANEGFQGVVPPVSAEKKMEQNSNNIAALINKGTEELNKANI